MLFFLFIIFIVALIALFCWQRNVSSTQVSSYGMTESFHFGSTFRLVSGLDNWDNARPSIKAELYDTEIVFYFSPFDSTNKRTLKYDQIIDLHIYTEKEIIEKSKSVAGRAVAGAALFGPVGAIIGGISGAGTKTSSKTHLYYTITYTASSGTAKMITLSDDCGVCDMSKFDNALKQFVNIKKEIAL